MENMEEGIEDCISCYVTLVNELNSEVKYIEVGEYGV